MEKVKLIELVRKLLALGDKTKNSSQAEAELAAEKAQELLKKYNLDLAEVIIKDQEKIVDVEIEKEIVFELKRNGFSNWIKNLMHIVGKATETKSYYQKTFKFRHGRSVTKSFLIGFLGTEWDRAIAKELFNYLYHTMNRMANRLYPGSCGNQRCFLEGFCSSLSKRINEKINNEKNEKYALLVLSKKKSIDNYARINFQSVGRRGRTADYFNYEAYKLGKLKAQEVDIGTSNRLQNE